MGLGSGRVLFLWYSVSFGLTSNQDVQFQEFG